MTVSKVETNPPDFNDFAGLHRLLLTEFAYMEGRIDPPSSLAALSQDDLRAKAGAEDLFILRDSGHLTGCLFGAARPDCYYIGKLAVAASQRGHGLARALIDAAASRARTLSLPMLELQSRVELMENHAAFAQMGFVQAAATAHPGYARPTSFTFRRAV
jgi:GNAT superfamily N-acetyltransferase